MKPANRLTTNSTRAITNNICAMPAAVEAMPPNPNTAATRAITRNINAQYNMSVSSKNVQSTAPALVRLQSAPQAPAAATGCPAARSQRGRGDGGQMRRELTPGEARGGTVSG